jgi:hypothetical protein
MIGSIAGSHVEYRDMLLKAHVLPMILEMYNDDLDIHTIRSIPHTQNRRRGIVFHMPGIDRLD